MKKLIVAAVLALSTASFATAWNIDQEHASANFQVKHLGVSNVNGVMGPISGTVEIDDKDPSKSKIDVAIDVTAIDTKWEKRNGHLKSPDFFDVAKYPSMKFKSTKIEKAGDNKLKITGDLTIKDVTKPVTLNAEFMPEVANPWSKLPTRGVSASTTINRQDWGLKWQAPGVEAVKVVGDEVKITIEAELIQKKDEAKPAAAPAKK